MADQVLPARETVLDANGAPVPGALITVYASGTATKIDVFTDEAGTTGAPNPIQADGSGRIPQRFVNVAARAVVTTADGATLYEMDPVPLSRTSSAASSAVSFAPTALIPVSNAQAAIERVQANIATTAETLQPLNADLTQIAALARAQGDLIVGGTSAWERLAKGTAHQSLAMDAAGTAPAYRAIGPVIGTAQTPTTATPADFTGLPAGINRFAVTFSDLNVSGTDNVLIQLGDAGGFETTGYAAGSRIVDTAIEVNSTSGFPICLQNATYAFSGTVEFTRITGNTWTCAICGFETGTNLAPIVGGGFKALSDVLTQVRVRPSGTDTFSASTTINIAFG